MNKSCYAAKNLVNFKCQPLTRKYKSRKFTWNQELHYPLQSAFGILKNKTRDMREIRKGSVIQAKDTPISSKKHN